MYMFSERLSQVTKDEVQAIIDSEVAEGIDLELKRELPARKGENHDPWMTGGRIGDKAKDELAAEIIAFANTAGGTLIVGIDENKQTKRAVPPIIPMPNCKVAAARLHQAIDDRIEPRLPTFECEGVITEADGSSGVVIMRTYQSYLMPHRHTQDNRCYVRRNDRAEPMSMLEIQETVRRAARGLEEIEKAFERSASELWRWIPAEWRATSRALVGGTAEDHRKVKYGVGRWVMRFTAKPLAALPITSLAKQRWLKLLNLEQFKGSGQQGWLRCVDLEVVRPWQPRLRKVERAFHGTNLLGVDQVGEDGQIDRYVGCTVPHDPNMKRIRFSMYDPMWNMASVMQMAHIIRSVNSRPTQGYAIEVELLASDPLVISGYVGPVPPGLQMIPHGRTVFPRYEIKEIEGFDAVLTLFDRDVWNAGGYDPDWPIAVDWMAV